MGYNDSEIGIPYALKDYIDLVEWTGRIMRLDMLRFIPKETRSFN